MKLLLYSHFFTPGVGGVETIVMSLANGLAELRDGAGKPRFQVTLVTQTAAGSLDDRTLPFLVVRRPGLFRLLRLISDASVVHVAGAALPPLILAWLGRKPFVVEHHGHQAICPNGILIHQPDRSVCPGHFQAGHYRECLRCQAVELSPSPRGLASLLLMFPRNALVRRSACNIAVSHTACARHALPHSQVVYHGIEDPGPEKPSEAAGAPAHRKLRFACLGRFVAEKGIPVLLEAAAILKREGHDFEVRLVGDGRERSALQKSIHSNQLADRVRITGFLQGAALAEEVAQAHVLVMPSVWEETAGLSAMEQMMRGRLVIASKIAGLGEMVGEAGLTFAAGDAQDLAARMREVLKNPGLIATIGSEARRRAQSLFMRDRMIADHAGIYDRLVDQSVTL